MSQLAAHYKSQRPRVKKESDDPNVKQILALRDSLQAKTKDPAEIERIGLACKGLFSCSKGTHPDPKCFDTILSQLQAIAINYGDVKMPSLTQVVKKKAKSSTAARPKGLTAAKAKKKSKAKRGGGGRSRSRSRSRSKSR